MESINPRPLPVYTQYAKPALEVLVDSLDVGDENIRTDAATDISMLCLDRPGILPDVVVPALRNRNVTSQLGGLAVIESMQTLASDEMPIDELRKKTRSNDTEIRQQAVRALSWHSGKYAEENLAWFRVLLENEGRDEVRLAIYEALIQGGATDLVAAGIAECLKILDGHQDTALQKQAIRILKSQIETVSKEERDTIEKKIDEVEVKHFLHQMIQVAVKGRSSGSEIEDQVIKEILVDLRSPVWRMWHFRILPFFRKIKLAIMDNLDWWRQEPKQPEQISYARKKSSAPQEINKLIDNILDQTRGVEERLRILDELRIHVSFFDAQSWCRLLPLLESSDDRIRQLTGRVLVYSFNITCNGPLPMRREVARAAASLLRKSYVEGGLFGISEDKIDGIRSGMCEFFAKTTSHDLFEYFDELEIRQLHEDVASYFTAHQREYGEGFIQYDPARFIVESMASLGMTEKLLQGARELLTTGKLEEGAALPAGFMIYATALSTAGAEFLPELKSRLDQLADDRSSVSYDKKRELARAILVITTPRHRIP